MLRSIRRLAGSTSREFQYVLVVALGRTGSTLVQGLLNSLDGYCIRGENDGFCHSFYRAVRALDRRHEQFLESGEELDTPRHPWYGLRQIDRSSLVDGFRSLLLEEVLRPDPGSTHVGFKEIRYAPKSVPDLDGYLEFLAELFPGVKFVVNVRDPAAVAKSSFWRKHQGDTVTHVREAQRRLLDAVSRSSIPHVVLEYEAYTQSETALRPMCELLDVPWQSQRFSEVLAQRHSI